MFGQENKKKGSKLLITSATISAAFPFGHLIIGTVPVEIKKRYGPFLDEDNKTKTPMPFTWKNFDKHITQYSYLKLNGDQTVHKARKLS